MNDGKALIQSKTFWGAVVVILSQVLQLAGYNIGPVDAWQNGIIDLVSASLANNVTGILGAAWAIYGRIRAVKPIKAVV